MSENDNPFPESNVIDGPWPKPNDPERVATCGGCPICHENHGHWNLELIGFTFYVGFYFCKEHRTAWEVPEEMEYLTESAELDVWRWVIAQDGYTECEPWYPPAKA